MRTGPAILEKSELIITREGPDSLHYHNIMQENIGIHAGIKAQTGNPFCHIIPERKENSCLRHARQRHRAGSYIYPPCKQIKTRDDTKLVFLRQNHGLGETAPNLWLFAGYHEHFFSSATCSCLLPRKRRDGPGEPNTAINHCCLLLLSLGHHSIHVLAINFG